MPPENPTLHILCGKIASGKSTLAEKLAAAPRTVRIAEDTWLDALYAHELRSLADYARCSTKLRSRMAPLVATLLDAGISVVLDFPANTVAQRRWMKDILDKTTAAHQFHVLEVPDEVCLARLRARNAEGAHPFAATAEQFHQFSKYFAPPTPDEGFNLVIHEVARDAVPEAQCG